MEGFIQGCTGIFPPICPTHVHIQGQIHHSATSSTSFFRELWIPGTPRLNPRPCRGTNEPMVSFSADLWAALSWGSPIPEYQKPSKCLQLALRLVIGVAFPNEVWSWGCFPPAVPRGRPAVGDKGGKLVLACALMTESWGWTHSIHGGWVLRVCWGRCLISTALHRGAMTSASTFRVRSCRPVCVHPSVIDTCVSQVEKAGRRLSPQVALGERLLSSLPRK